MKSLTKSISLAAAVAVLGLSGCWVGPAATGSFDRTLKVTGPVRLELQFGAGNATIRPGSTDQVRIHAEFKVRSMMGMPSRRASEIASNPPVEQNGNLIRIGKSGVEFENIEFHYTISVPAATEVNGTAGSGTIDVSGVRGPAELRAGSGDLRATDLDSDVSGRVGSGSVDFRNIGGVAKAEAGSGELQLRDVKGEIRASAGSGDIEIDHPGSTVEAHTGSGNVRISGVTADLRLRTGSGSASVQGDPRASSYWEIHAGSGDVDLVLPTTASALLAIKSSSGGIHTDLPLVVEQQFRHEVQGRIGDGKARIEVQTGSGGVRIH